MNLLGERIEQLRKERNMTQEELAQEMNFKTYTTVSKWESGKNLPRGKELKMLAELFGVSSDYILGISDERKIKTNSISTIYNQLEPSRRKKVYSFAEQQLEEQSQLHTIEVVGKTAAGEPVTYGDGDTEEKQVKHVPEGADCALNVQGDSMEPNC